MIESDLRWFVHIRRRFIESPVRRADQIDGNAIVNDEGDLM